MQRRCDAPPGTCPCNTAAFPFQKITEKTPEVPPDSGVSAVLQGPQSVGACGEEPVSMLAPALAYVSATSPDLTKSVTVRAIPSIRAKQGMAYLSSLFHLNFPLDFSIFWKPVILHPVYELSEGC